MLLTNELRELVTLISDKCVAMDDFEVCVAALNVTTALSDAFGHGIMSASSKDFFNKLSQRLVVMYESMQDIEE